MLGPCLKMGPRAAPLLTGSWPSGSSAEQGGRLIFLSVGQVVCGWHPNARSPWWEVAKWRPEIRSLLLGSLDYWGHTWPG